jgi:anti-sigma B factor antagonist
VDVEGPTSRTAAVIRASGEVDLATAGRFGAELEQAIGSGPKTVVVDLSDVSFMDSAGVNTILNARSLAQTAGVELVLRRPQGEAAKILEFFSL